VAGLVEEGEKEMEAAVREEDGENPKGFCGWGLVYKLDRKKWSEDLECKSN
jgi:hypothetical protein